jgi:homoserine kinase
MSSITVRSPASAANLGPGFDCLGLALNLWNQTTFSLEGQGMQVEVWGEGNNLLAADDDNLVARAAMRLYQAVGAPLPEGLLIRCENHIPLGGGLGSSAAAIVSGLVGANALLGTPLSDEDLLRLATAMEGHPDNVATALAGGLTLVTTIGEGVLARRLPAMPLQMAVVVPAVHLPTQVARAALPREVPLVDAVYNIGRTAFVIEALRIGDLGLLGKVMDDRLHQPYRMKLIPGAEMAFSAARRAGAAAVALSGAGPTIVAFAPASEKIEKVQAIATAMAETFEASGIPARSLALTLSEQGSHVVKEKG